jgi:hypothetical protein
MTFAPAGCASPPECPSSSQTARPAAAAPGNCLRHSHTEAAITHSFTTAIWIHLVAVLAGGVFYAVTGQVKPHRFTMISLFAGGLVVAGAFTLPPQRLLGHMLWTAVGNMLATAAAQSPAAQEAPFIDAVQAFQQARDGDNSRIEPAIAAFEALARAEPGNPVHAAYLGSAFSLRGRQAWMPWNKMKYSEQGLDHIDRALEALKPEHDRRSMRGVPVSLETRFIAASTFVNLPDSIFHRRAAGRKLLDELLRHPALAAAPEPFRSAVHKTAAEAARVGQ